MRAAKLGCVWLAVALSVSTASAANLCPRPGSGIGGTGPVPESGIGGTGRPAASGIGGTGSPAASGIGGTGATARGGVGGSGSPAGGIGGTGAVARGGIGGTGVVGTITGFASICVNDIEIHYDPKTPIEVDGRRATLDTLSIGQVVSAEAAGSGDEVAARRIAVLHAVAGPAEQVDATAGTLRVLGQRVQVAPVRLAGIGAGDWVRVSGLRSPDDTLVASHIERTQTQGEGLILGPASPRGGRWEVYGVPIDRALDVTAGTEVMVRGRWDGTSLQAREVVVRPSLRFGGDVRRLSVEGFARHKPDGRWQVGPVELERNAAIWRLVPGERIRVTGRLQGERLVVERVDRQGIQAESRSPSASSSGEGRGSSGERGGAEDRTGSSGRGSGSDRPGRGERPEERPERAERPEAPERPEKVDRPEKPDKPEKVERPEKSGRVERPETSGRR